MSYSIIRILFFCIIPIGIFILTKAVQLLKRTFNGKIIAKIPYSQNGGQFTVSKAQTYSVWQQGELFKRTPVDNFKLHIYEKTTKKEMKLQFSLLRPQANGLSKGRMELFRFYAAIGNYKIEFRKGSNILKIESLIGNILNLEDSDLKQYSIEIRESQPQIMTFLGILMLLLGMCATVGGLVLGILADQILK